MTTTTTRRTKPTKSTVSTSTVSTTTSDGTIRENEKCDFENLLPDKKNCESTRSINNFEFNVFKLMSVYFKNTSIVKRV